MKLSQLHQEISRSLMVAGLPDSRREAALLIIDDLQINRADLYAHPDLVVPDEQIDRVRKAAERRAGHEPLAYITGRVWFMDNLFLVGRGVLVPRPDSEVLVETALTIADSLPNRELMILDTCTGTGCIGISIGISLHRQHRLGQLLLTEIDESAAHYARLNLDRYPLDGRSDLVLTDLLPHRSCGEWDLVVANPPYIAGDVINSLMPEVSLFEPRKALDGGPDGLDFYRRLIAGAPDMLCPGGVLLLEHGFDQAEAVQGLLEQDGRFELLQTVFDYGGQPRVSGGFHRPIS